MTQTATKPEITATAIYRVTSKEDGRECYMVPSDSQPGLFYQTCWNRETNCWDCTCKHGEVQAARGQTARCKHVAAAHVVITARANALREQPKREAKSCEFCGAWTYRADGICGRCAC